MGQGDPGGQHQALARRTGAGRYSIMFHELLRCTIFSGRMSESGRGCAKTKSDLVVMPSEGRIFAFFCSERDHEPQNSGCGYTALSFHTAWVITSRQNMSALATAFAESGHRRPLDCGPDLAGGGGQPGPSTLQGPTKAIRRGGCPRCPRPGRCQGHPGGATWERLCLSRRSTVLKLF
jgi:hypothetical protein